MIDIIQSSSIEEDGSSPSGAPERNDVSNIKVRDDEERRETNQQHHYYP
jgi:hypothetical protein